MSNCNVIGLTNQKGGVGKTTTAINLGVGLAMQKNIRVLRPVESQGAYGGFSKENRLDY